jgi:hypothetical protein
MAAQKEYLYKVYDQLDNYIGVWNDVVSDYGTSEQINSAGSTVKVVLARPADDFGEGIDVDFDYVVRIYAIDADEVNGTPLFTGYISSYTPVFDDDEKVEIDVWGFGAKLDSFIIQDGELADVVQDSSNTSYNSGYNIPGAGYVRSIAQTFQPTTSGDMSRIDLKLQSLYDHATTAYLILRDGTPAATEPGGYDDESASLATATAAISPDAVSTYSFNFSTAVPVIAGDTYWFEVYAKYDGWAYSGSGPYATIAVYATTIDPYADGQLYLGDKSPMVGGTPSNPNGAGQSYYTAQTGKDIWFTTYQNTGSTTAAYNSYDPSDILRAILDDYVSRGGVVNYDVDSIEDTGTVVSYTFNTNTVWEGMKKCLELAPAGWYLYIDQSTNLVHFHPKANVSDYEFTMGKDIITISPEKRTEDIKNIIYFTGGGDPPLFRVYTAPDSIELYGPKVHRYVDQRVTVAATATAIANSILDESRAPELRLSVTVLDNSLDPVRGMDIESITLGQMIGIRNVEGYGPTLWDISEWDVDYWDFNIQDLSSPVLQIVRIERTPDKATIFCSTTPPDVSKRIEDINRNLEASQTVNNPAVAE